VLNLVTTLDPKFTEPIRPTLVLGVLYPPLQIKNMTPLALPRGRMTLLRAAVHPMSPFQGQGGNMAMKDGFSLAKILAGTKAGRIEDVFETYE
jgi:2-polyprenyl-6-methoxyphenol hydroxylase-like FAD-dependent oxidoreductase